MLSRRVDHFVESVIRDMTRLSIKHDAINLAQGFPDFPAPEELKRAAADAIMGDYNQYSITWGAKDLMKYMNISCTTEKNTSASLHLMK